MAGRDIAAVELEGYSSWLTEGLRGRQESGRKLVQQAERQGSAPAESFPVVILTS